MKSAAAGHRGDGQEDYDARSSAYDHISFWQLLSFSFVTPVVKQGLRKPLQQGDIEEVRVVD